MKDFNFYMGQFLEYLKYEKNYSLLTINGYKEDLIFLNDYFNKENINFLEVEYQDIRLLYNYLEDKHYSKNTIARHISSIRSFYKYLSFNKIINNNPFNMAHLPKKDKMLPKFLYYNELMEMFDSIKLDDFYGKRNRCILEVLYATGVRVSELVNIKLSDIDFDNGTIRVIGKGNKERIVYFLDYPKKYMLDYIENGRNVMLNNKPCEYLFINKLGNKLTTRGVELIIKDIISKTSIKSNVTPHTIRHTFATHLLNEGCDIMSVKELLGHESLKATQVYTHITNEELRNIYLNCHPRSKK